MLSAALSGLATGLSLIVAIGAQNAFVLRQGLLRRHVGVVVAICAFSDLVLIVAGVAGVGALVAHAGALLDVVRWAGVVFLAGYGLRSLVGEPLTRALDRRAGADAAAPRGLHATAVASGGPLSLPTSEHASAAPGRARHAEHPEADPALDEPGSARRAAVLTALALTWLNPHVYLDTVLLLGSVANTHGPTGRWWFAVGAGTASVVWFGALGFGTRPLAPLLAGPRAWRVLDVVIGVTMISIAVLLARG